MSAKSTKKGVDHLGVLFPHAVVTCPDNSQIKVKPVMAEELPQVMDSFSEIVKIVDANTPPAMIAIAALKQLMDIMPLCTGRPKSEIPSAVVPEILNIMIKQNFTDSTLGNWKALIQKLSEIAEAPVEQSQ